MTSDLETRLAALAIGTLADTESRLGHATAALLRPEECRLLRDLCAADGGDGLDRRVDLDDAAAGRGSYRHFLVPAPLPIAALRAALFAPAAALADELRVRLGDKPCFPRSLDRWLRGSRTRGDSRWVALGAGGFLATARADDRRAFPLRALLDLGPDDAPVTALAIVDQRPGKKVHASAAATRAGDLVFFACRERLSAVAGRFGLQLIRYGLGPVDRPRVLLDFGFDGL